MITVILFAALTRKSDFAAFADEGGWLANVKRKQFPELSRQSDTIDDVLCMAFDFTTVKFVFFSD